MNFILNGRNVEINKPEGSLLSYLRNVAGLTGTKEGCSTGACGSCTVLLDGIPVRSCVTSLSSLQDRSVLTIEGITDHRIEQAFLDAGAVQCGFCTPAMILTAKALLEKNNAPDINAVIKAFRSVFCRCTGYAKIIEGIRLASERIYGTTFPDRIEKVDIVDIHGNRVSRSNAIAGKAVHDKDGREKCRGQYLFADDLKVDGLLFGRPLFAGIPHARIISIDVSKAIDIPGVVKIFTADDVPGLNASGMAVADWPVFVSTEVMFPGDVIAFVVASSIESAEKGLSAISVTYEELDPVITIEEAERRGWIQNHIDYSYGDIDKVRKDDSLIVIKDSFETSFVEHGYLEPESVLCQMDGDVLVVNTPTQAPFEHRDQLSRILNVDKEKIRIKVTPLGGGFGGKGDLTIQPLAAIATMELKRPVKVTLKRNESMMMSTKKHPYHMEYEAGFSPFGELVYIDAILKSNAGPYSALTPRVLDQSCIFAVGPYRTKAGRVSGTAYITNTAVSSAMRGFGINQVSFAMESIMDIASKRLGMDSFSIRRKNIFRLGDETFTGEKLTSSVSAYETLQICEKEMDRIREKYQKYNSNADHVIGFGISSCFKNVGAGKGRVDNAGARIVREKNGMFTLFVSGVDMGQGFRTAMVQIAAEILNVSSDSIKVLNGDTVLTLRHGSAVGERQTLISGKAVEIVSLMMLEKIKIAGESDYLECEYYHEAPKTYSLCDIEAKRTVPPEEYRNYPSYTYGTYGVAIDLDLKTGKVKVLDVIAVNDAGFVINPNIVAGQLEGSCSMGIGYALSEKYITGSNGPVTKTYSSLGIPRITSVPVYHLILIENPESNGPMGAKGMSEIGTIPVTGAIANAIYDAAGIRIHKVPATPDYILSLLERSDVND